MLTLYDFGNSVCQKVRITLSEKGIDWESRRSRSVQQ